MSIVISSTVKKELNYHAIYKSKLFVDQRSLRDEEDLLKELGVWELEFDYAYFDIFVDNTLIIYPMWEREQESKAGNLVMPFFMYIYKKKINIIVVPYTEHRNYDNEKCYEYA